MLGGLLSCTKPVKKNMDIPTTFPSSSPSYKMVSQLPYTAWWQQFNDPELNRLMSAGLRVNRDIHIAIGNLQQAKGVLQEVNLSWLPTVQLWGGYSTNPALGVPGAFYAAWPYYTVNIMQLYSQHKQAKYTVMYYQAAIDGIKLTIIGQISAAYFTLIAQQERLALLNQLDDDLKILIKLNEQDIVIGLADNISVNQLRSEEQIISAQRHPIVQNIRASENALHYLVNENPGRIKDYHSFSQVDFTKIKPGNLPAEVLNNRPDMKMAVYAVRAAYAGVEVAYSNFFPVIQLDDFVGEVTLPTHNLANALDSYAVANLAPSLLGKITSSKGKRYAVIAELQKTIKRILNEVDTDYADNKNKTKQLITYQKAQYDYEKKYKLQHDLFNTGLISYKELIQSKIYLDNLALQVNQVKLSLALSLVVLYQDLAGGYAHQEV